MDDLGVLVGIRPQGKSAPMAASKAAASNRTRNHMDPPLSTSKSKPNSSSDQFDPFGFGYDQKPSNGGGVRGWDFDIEAVLKGSMNLNKKSNLDDDLLWGVSGDVRSKGGVVDGVDLLSSDTVAVDNWDNLSRIGSGSRVDDTDVLFSGFEMGSSTSAQASSTHKISGSSSIEELEDFGSGRTKKKANGSSDAFKINMPKTTFKTKSAEPNLIDVDIGVGGFGGGSIHQEKAESASQKKANGSSDVFKINMPKTTFKTKSAEPNLIDVDIGVGGFGGSSIHQEKVESASQNFFEAGVPDLDSIFGAYTQTHKPAPEKTIRNVKAEEVFSPIPSIPVSINKNASRVNSYDDLFFGVATMSTQFEEVDGESKERRSARLAHYQSTQARMAGALADLNEREFRAQQEQEERHRIAEAMDMKIKQWAAGKEGNLRALLSSLQLVLAPELGWKGVTLTDLITSTQVKIAYKKAALCVHPDKVQQKGANLQQKYVAEKVFDFLKEAWNKFNSEELR